MAEIRFTTERMKEVYNRLDDIANQLRSSVNSSNEMLTSISNNIQSDNIKTILSSYTSTAQDESLKTINNIEALKAYLESKIGSYTSVDQAGIDSISEIESILSQLEI